MVNYSTEEVINILSDSKLSNNERETTIDSI